MNRRATRAELILVLRRSLLLFVESVDLWYSKGQPAANRVLRFRCCLLRAGDHFSAGLDLTDGTNMDGIAGANKDVGRRAFRFRKLAMAMQARNGEPRRVSVTTLTPVTPKPNSNLAMLCQGVGHFHRTSSRKFYWCLHARHAARATVWCHITNPRDIFPRTSRNLSRP